MTLLLFDLIFFFLSMELELKFQKLKGYITVNDFMIEINFIFLVQI